MSHEAPIHPDRDDDALERSLNELADSERDVAPPGLEDRVFEASAPVLGGVARRAHIGDNTDWSAPRAHTGGRSPAPPRRRASHVRLRWAIAAGLGAMAGVTAWLALREASAPEQPIADVDRTRSPGSATDPAAELDAMVLASSLLGQDFGTEIDAIEAGAASLGLSLADPLSTGDASWQGDWSTNLEGESL